MGKILYYTVKAKFYSELFIVRLIYFEPVVPNCSKDRHDGNLHDGAQNYNPGHNILRHFDVWQNFRVTTSEMNRD